MGRTQPEKPWHGLKLNLSLHIGTFFDSLQLSFQEKERRMCGLYQIRFTEKKIERGHCEKQSKMFDIDLFLFFFSEMK